MMNRRNIATSPCLLGGFQPLPRLLNRLPITRMIPVVRSHLGVVSAKTILQCKVTRQAEEQEVNNRIYHRSPMYNKMTVY